MNADLFAQRLQHLREAGGNEAAEDLAGAFRHGPEAVRQACNYHLGIARAAARRRPCGVIVFWDTTLRDMLDDLDEPSGKAGEFA